jgi:hypothetical protein
MGTKFWEKMSGAQLTFMVSLFISFGYFFEGYNQGNMGFVNTAPSYQVSSWKPFQFIDLGVAMALTIC